MIRTSFLGALLMSLMPLAAPVVSAEPTLADRYKAGRIAVRIDEDWTSNLPSNLNFESRGSLAVAPDGSVFVSNTTRYMIYKFDSAGKFVRAFGRQGQGPGDLTYPGRLSILDSRYLVVGEYATNQRISLFDLDGRFVKIVAPGRFTAQATALKDGRIAYLSTSGRMAPGEMINVDEAFIIDTKSGAQKSVFRRESRNPMKRRPNGTYDLIMGGNVILTRAGDGRLVVADTDGSRLEVFAADGSKLEPIETGWKAIPITPEYRIRYEAHARRQAMAEGRKPAASYPLAREVMSIIRDVWTDSEGNILVARNAGCLDECPIEFRAYSPRGEALGDFVLEPGPVVLAADFRFRRVALTPAGLFGLLERKDDPDEFLLLFKTSFN